MGTDTVANLMLKSLYFYVKLFLREHLGTVNK